MKGALASWGLVLVSTLVGLGSGEIVVRALFREQAAIFPRYHTDYRYGEYTLRGIRPNARFWHTSTDGSWEFVTNSKGLRDRREHAYEKPAGTFRVLALGDSHTQGYEVRQQATYSMVLERYLATRGVPAVVLNAGVSGFSTAEALAYLENEGYRYQPDVVVLGFYANDFEDNLKAGLFALEGAARGRAAHRSAGLPPAAEPRLVPIKQEHIPGVRIQNAIYSIPGVQWLGENSYFYSLLFNSVWMHAKLLLHAHATQEPDGQRGRTGEFEYAVATRDSHSPYAVDLAIALIQRMQRFCRERGMRLIVLDVPRPGLPYRITESLPQAAVKRLTESGIEVIGSRALLGEFDGTAEMHVSAGARHIGEFTHAIIGAELGRRIAPSLLGVKTVDVTR
jgi:hypothetical protein